MSAAGWEEHHARLCAEQARRKSEGISNNPIADISYEVAVERANQDAKFGKVGEVVNLPSVNLTTLVLIAPERVAKAACDTAQRSGTKTWAHVAIEELSESIDADGDVARRAELVQLAAVVFAWIENIDIRAARGAK